MVIRTGSTRLNLGHVLFLRLPIGCSLCGSIVPVVLDLPVRESDMIRASRCSHGAECRLKNVKHNVVYMMNDDVDTPTQMLGKKIAPILEIPGPNGVSPPPDSRADTTKSIPAMSKTDNLQSSQSSESYAVSGRGYSLVEPVPSWNNIYLTILRHVYACKPPWHGYLLRAVS